MRGLHNSFHQLVKNNTERVYHMGKRKQTQTLVTIVQNEARVDSRIIAKGLGISHRAFMQTIRKYQNKLETLGFLSFEMTKTTADEDGRGRPETYVMLNEDQVTFAMQLSRSEERRVGKECR